MNPATLRQIITQLENGCFHISLEMPGRPHDVDTFCAQLQRLLDETQQRLDDLRGVRDLPPPPSLDLLLMHPCDKCGTAIPLEQMRCFPCKDYEHISGRPAPMIHREGACTRCGERGQLRPDGVCLPCHDELGRTA